MMTEFIEGIGEVFKVSGKLLQEGKFAYDQEICAGSDSGL